MFKEIRCIINLQFSNSNNNNNNNYHLQESSMNNIINSHN